MHPPLKYLVSWSPFRLDALGLLTMLGGPEMSRAIGHLGFHRFTEFLPTFGAYTVPSNDFVQPLSGFTLYNITDSISSTTFAGWFSRWLLAQNASENTTVFTWEVKQLPAKRQRVFVLAATIGFLANCTTTLLSCLVGDWYGFASAFSINVSIFVRWYLVTQNRQAIDRGAVEETAEKSSERVKTLCVLADNKIVTVFAPRNVVVNCFLTTPRPLHPRIYSVVRGLGWLSFAVFVVSIGQAALFFQLVIVVLTLIATLVTVSGIGNDRMAVGNRLSISRREHSKSSERRIETYCRLDLSQSEEDTMVDWALVPQRKNVDWWKEYHGMRTKAKSEKSCVQGIPKERQGQTGYPTILLDDLPI